MSGHDAVDRGRAELRRVAGFFAELEVRSGIRIEPRSAEEGVRIRRFVRSIQMLGAAQHYQEVFYRDFDSIMDVFAGDMTCWLRRVRGEEETPGPPPLREDVRRRAKDALCAAREALSGRGGASARRAALAKAGEALAALDKKTQNPRK